MENKTQIYQDLPDTSYLRDRYCSIFSGAGKLCLALGLRQLTRDVTHDVRTLNFRMSLLNDAAHYCFNFNRQIFQDGDHGDSADTGVSIAL